MTKRQYSALHKLQALISKGLYYDPDLSSKVNFLHDFEILNRHTRKFSCGFMVINQRLEKWI